jgi:hypothetical protein
VPLIADSDALSAVIYIFVSLRVFAAPQHHLPRVVERVFVIPLALALYYLLEVIQPVLAIVLPPLLKVIQPVLAITQQDLIMVGLIVLVAATYHLSAIALVALLIVLGLA